MSRYVRVELAASVAELEAALDRLGLKADRGMHGAQVMLEGSLECAGEPADMRFVAGTLGAVEDFGFRLDGGMLALVCGDVDRRVLERELLAPVNTQIARARLEQEAAAKGLELNEEVQADGTRRIVLRRP